MELNLDALVEAFSKAIEPLVEQRMIELKAFVRVEIGRRFHEEIETGIRSAIRNVVEQNVYVDVGIRKMDLE